MKMQVQKNSYPKTNRYFSEKALLDKGILANLTPERMDSTEKRLASQHHNHSNSKRHFPKAHQCTLAKKFQFFWQPFWKIKKTPNFALQKGDKKG